MSSVRRYTRTYHNTIRILKYWYLLQYRPPVCYTALLSFSLVLVVDCRLYHRLGYITFFMSSPRVRG